MDALTARRAATRQLFLVSAAVVLVGDVVLVGGDGPPTPGQVLGGPVCDALFLLLLATGRRIGWHLLWLWWLVPALVLLAGALPDSGRGAVIGAVLVAQAVALAGPGLRRAPVLLGRRRPGRARPAPGPRPGARTVGSGVPTQHDPEELE